VTSSAERPPDTGKLTPLADNIWTVNQPLRVIGLNLGHRMTVVKLKTGALWVHSPVKLTDTIKVDLEELGPVGCVVAPSCVHDLYLDDYAKAYPDVSFYTAPGFKKTAEFEQSAHTPGPSAPEVWADEIAQIRVAGVPRINEVVFLHKRSRSLIVADLVFNINHRKRLLDRLALRLYGCYGRATPSRLFIYIIRNKESFSKTLERILQWDFERIIVGHGDIIENDAKEILRTAYENKGLLP